jgi:hypothetical protein
VAAVRAAQASAQWSREFGPTARTCTTSRWTRMLHRPGGAGLYTCQLVIRAFSPLGIRAVVILFGESKPNPIRLDALAAAVELLMSGPGGKRAVDELEQVEGLGMRPSARGRHQGSSIVSSLAGCAGSRRPPPLPRGE